MGSSDGPFGVMPLSVISELKQNVVDDFCCCCLSSESDDAPSNLSLIVRCKRDACMPARNIAPLFTCVSRPITGRTLFRGTVVIRTHHILKTYSMYYTKHI